MRKSRSVSRTKPAPPKRPSHEWRRLHFSIPPDLDDKLRAMAAVYGEGIGAFLRFLLRTEWKGFSEREQASSDAP